MSILATGLSGVSNLLQSSVAASSIATAQNQLLTLEEEISTGKQINTPSDNPSSAALIEQLNRSLATQQTYTTNINSATSQLGETDSQLGSLTTLLEQAEQLASANVGTDSTDADRQAAAAVAQSLYSQALSIANTQFNGSYIFAGDGTTQPFVEANGGVEFTGSTNTPQNVVDAGTTVPIAANGAEVFGAVSAGVIGGVNLNPTLSSTDSVSNLAGANGTGITLGPIQISDGTVTKTVDLSNATTVGDIASLINAAGVGSITASVTSQGLQLTGSPSENITVSDIGTANTATALGIATAPTGAGVGVAVTGAPLEPQITDVTPLSSLRGGAGLDSTGFNITVGATTKTITWPANGNVQDLLNAVNGAGLGVKATIDTANNGIDIQNMTQGVSMSISENGGQSATELGVRSYSPSTPLADLNGGTGVTTAGGTTPDFQITRKDGTTFTVALGSDTTIQDVINSINTADGGNGVAASFSTTGNGIVLTDTTGGSGTLTVTQMNSSNAASELGLNVPASGNVLTGSEVNPQEPEGIFSNLQALITALQTNNQAGITAAGTGITNDTNRVISAHGAVGAVEQELASRQTDLTQQSTATQTLLSTLQDTDMTTAITQYTSLQTTLQASLMTSAQTLQLSLLDYLA